MTKSNNQPPTTTTSRKDYESAFHIITEQVYKLPNEERLAFKIDGITEEEVEEQLAAWKDAAKRGAATPWIEPVLASTHRVEIHPNQASFSIEQYRRKDNPALASRAGVSLIHLICTMKDPEPRHFDHHNFSFIREGIQEFKRRWASSIDDTEGKRFRLRVIETQLKAVIRRYVDAPRETPDTRPDGDALDIAVRAFRRLHDLKHNLLALRPEDFAFGIVPRGRVPEGTGAGDPQDFHFHIVATPGWCQQSCGTDAVAKMKDARAFQDMIQRVNTKNQRRIKVNAC
ncbi:hypothetical protein PG997_003295 [Apiospora hydei]|uniref:Uncharacterized protein n=1 Tax=Apiospora hydei TaxID=1337664 RepID=A0ABR1WYX7_9PEZI